MATATEQLFLYGEVIDSTSATGLMALIGYADLTVSGSIAFAAIILASILGVYWGNLISWILNGVELFIAFWRENSPFTTGPSIKSRLKESIAHSCIIQAIATISDSYYSLNRPGATALRLAITLVGGMVTHSAFLRPGLSYISGVSNGLQLSKCEHSDFCLEVLGHVTHSNAPSQLPLKAYSYCIGEEAGLDLRTIIHHLHQTLDGDIHHSYILIFVAACISLVILVGFLLHALANYNLLRPLPAEEDLTNNTSSSNDLILRKEIEIQANKIDDYECLLTTQKSLLADKDHELKEAKQQAQDAWEMVSKLSARRNAADATRSQAFTENIDLRRELAQKDGLLSIARAKLQQVEEESTAKVETLTNSCTLVKAKLNQVEEESSAKIANEEQEILDGDTPSLKDELQYRDDQIEILNSFLAATEARESQDQSRAQETEAKLQHAIAGNNDLSSQNQGLSIQCEMLEAIYDDLAQQSQERIAALEQDLAATRSTAENLINEAQASVLQLQSQQTVVELRSSMQELKHACDMTLAQERAAAEQARNESSALSTEVKDLQTRIGMALRDAQRSHEQAVNAQRTVEVLERRLARWEVPRGSQQEIPKRQTRDPGSISTALAQCQLNLSKPTGTGTSPREDAMKEEMQKLRTALEKERRARTDDQVRWDKRTRELRDENQKLRISLSNASASLVRRGGPRRMVP